MDDTQRIVKCGNLSLHSPGGFFKKRWHSKYLVLYDGSKSGVKRLELFDSEIKFKKQQPAKIIPLVDCVRVVTCQRNKTTYTFEVRTSDQFYLLAGQSFQDMNDWVNCLRLVAFGQQPAAALGASTTSAQRPLSTSSLAAGHQAHRLHSNQSTGENDTADQQQQPKSLPAKQVRPNSSGAAIATARASGGCHMDVLLEKRLPEQSPAPLVNTDTHPALTGSASGQQRALTANQAAAAAANALAKTRQRQPSLLGSCKPQPPNDSPFISQVNQLSSLSSAPLSLPATSATSGSALNSIGQLDTLTPAVRGQLISSARLQVNQQQHQPSTNQLTRQQSADCAAVTQQAQQTSQLAAIFASRRQVTSKLTTIQSTLDEEEENMLYCSIEDNPSEHNYRVKVIETELSLRCQLKCYQLTAPTTISQQYESLGQLSGNQTAASAANGLPPQVTFYQLIIGPQELTLLNDYAALSLRQQQQLASQQQQQGLWSWPYQCIRRYGFDKDNCFMFEAGRKCSSGPGQFIVQTPKAYSIYQDVVKFVNELRSLSSGQPDSGAPLSLPPQLNHLSGNNHQQPTNCLDYKQKQLVVTQIPVTWTPANNSNNINVEAGDPTKQQFFNTLRQLDASGGGLPEIVETNNNDNNNKTAVCLNGSAATRLQQTEADNSCSGNSTINSAQVSPDGSQSAASPIKSAAEEETDESGYDQGEDSAVDTRSSGSGQQQPISLTQRLKSQAGATRKRQAPDSMSSASSTSSGGGSPGQSVSRRSAGSSGLVSASGGAGSGHAASQQSSGGGGGQGPSKRPPLLTHHALTGNEATSGADKQPSAKPMSGVRNLLASGALGQADEFEANLIRDVYSEISKLHATFAVASGSASDESMSSSSSSSTSGGSTSSSSSEGQFLSGGSGSSHTEGYSSSNTNRTQEGQMSDEEEDDDEEESDRKQPTYSNLRLPRVSGLNRQSYPNSRYLPTAADYEELEASSGNQPETGSGNRKSQTQTSSRQQLTSKAQQFYMNNRGATNHQLPPQNDYLMRSGQITPIATTTTTTMYPTILNPIPECGDELSGDRAPPTRPKSIAGSLQPPPQKPAFGSQQNLAANNRKSVGRVASVVASRQLVATDKRNNNQQNSNRISNRSQHSISSKSTHKLPLTNHYVINDVQYAKISRNVCSKYESCL